MRVLAQCEASVRVLLLDPDCSAANRRAEIEIGGPTIDDIRSTILRGIPSTMLQRLAELDSGTLGALVAKWRSPAENEHNGALAELKRLVQLEVRTYEFDPTLFMMQFDDGLFVEQYHFGRPKGKVPYGGCIGKFLPVLQFRRDALSYEFLEAHFEYLWGKSRDRTGELLTLALELYQRHAADEILAQPGAPPDTP